VESQKALRAASRAKEKIEYLLKSYEFLLFIEPKNPDEPEYRNPSEFCEAAVKKNT